MKGKIDKAKTIFKAFTSDKPIEEKWYQDRLSTCETCEYNSFNMKDEDLTFTQKLMTKGLCSTKGQCTACGCCIYEKTSVKTETCGLKEIGKTPKWNALEVGSQNNDIFLEVLEDTGLVKNTGAEFLFDLGIVESIVGNSKFLIKGVDPITFLRYSVGCGCTHPKSIEQIDDRTLKLDVTISTLSFREGINEKTLTVEYKNKKGDIQKSVIRFRIIKQYPKH
jgi:hypothetical protein